MNTIELAQLQRSPVFQGVSAPVIQQFLDEYPYAVRSYDKRDFIVFQGDVCDRVYILYSGSIQAQMIGSDGKKLVVEELSTPCILAPAFVYATENKFPVTLEVLAPDTLVLVIDRDPFWRLMQRQPQVMRNFIRVVSDRTITLANKVNSFALQTLRVRLAHYFYHHKEPASLRYIAEYLGVARPSLSRVLAQLIEEGYIEQEKRTIHVPNRERLKEIINSNSIKK